LGCKGRMMNVCLQSVCASAVFVAVVVAGCGDRADCRHKRMACAEGFACEEKGGEWLCTKEAALPKVVKEAVAPTSAKPKAKNFPRAAKVETRECREHRRCSKNALSCRCDAEGRLVEQILDRDKDGEGDEKALFQYNQNDELTFVIVDEGMDGVDDVRHEYGYRSEGVPLFWEIRRSLSSPTKKPNSRLEYSYDGDGKLIRETYDTGADGTPDRVCTYETPCPPPFPNPACKPVCGSPKPKSKNGPLDMSGSPLGR
jgi:hypothetical protein